MILEHISYKQPYMTVEEASELCGVTKPTIRKKVKAYDMKTYTDDRKRLHIRTIDILDYYWDLYLSKLNKEVQVFIAYSKGAKATAKSYRKMLRKIDDLEDIPNDSSDIIEKYENEIETLLRYAQMHYRELRDIFYEMAVT